MERPYGATLELGERGNPPFAISATSHGLGWRRVNSIGATISSWMSRIRKGFYERDGHERQRVQIEDYRNGYPRYSALLASHDSFHICRRFPYLRVYLLLLKQDRLSMLEQRLERINREEANPLRLGSCRSDNNVERNLVLSEIDVALADYDVLIERNHRILSLETARPRLVSSLRNWINGNGCVAREETAYLTRSEELASVADTDDTVMIWLETIVGNYLTRLQRYLRKQRYLDISRDPNVHIPSKSSTTRLARGLMTPFIITLLLAPVIVCNCLTSLAARLCVIVIATTVFMAVLSSSTKAKTVELIVAGATYTTVLVVFISSTNTSGNNTGCPGTVGNGSDAIFGVS